MIIILGKGQLGSALQKHLGQDHCVMLGRPDFDFATQADCDRVLEQYPHPEIIINTIGVVSQDQWKNLIVNFVSPAYLTMQYMARAKNCHIINISSASAWWVSYPGLDLNRFSYNLAKDSLSNFGRHINRIVVDQARAVTLTTIEPGKFQSPMSDHTGMEIKRVVDAVDYAIKAKPQHLSVIK